MWWVLCAALGTPPPAQAQGASGVNRDTEETTEKLNCWVLNMKLRSSPPSAQGTPELLIAKGWMGY